MTHKHFDLTNRLALITGSSQGIGLALAEGLAAYGAVSLPPQRRRAATRVKQSSQ